MYRFARVALCVILVLPAARLAADTIVSQNLQWTLSAGVNTVEATDKSIHIAQKVGKDTKDYALLTCPVDLRSYGDWTFSCDFRLGKRESAGSYVTLKAGNNSVLLAGGDMWGKQGPVVVLSGRQVLGLTRDNEWHHIDVRYARGAATATVDGVDVGKAAVPHSPDSVEVGTQNPNSGQQTEIFVRDITITKNHKLEPSVPTPSPSDRSPTVHPSSQASTGGTPPIQTSEPRTLVTETKGLVPITSDSAIKLRSLHFRFIDTYNLEPARGLLSKIRGVWIISAELVNDSDKLVTVIPGVLNFDNHAFEGLYPQVGWKFYEQNVNIRGGGLGAELPDIQFGATYYSPVAGLNVLTRLEPGKRTEVDLYAENGGGWHYVVNQRPNGYSAGPEPIERNPVSLSLLCVTDPDAVQKRLDTLYNTQAILYIEAPNTVPCCRALDGLKKFLKSPPPKDPLWVNIPINKETLSLVYKNAHF